MEKQRDQISLGVSGLVTTSKDHVAVEARKVGRVKLPQFLLTEDQRVEWLNNRLDRQLDYPLTAPGSDALARRIMGRFPSNPIPEFSRKLLLTLRDGDMHSTVAIASDVRPVGLGFVAWRGSWQDLIAKRYGLYLNSFLDCMSRIAKRVGPLAGFLQIDAFINESVDQEDPLRPLEECITLDVEFTYLPGRALGGAQTDDPSLPKVVILNLDLCSDDQKDQLKPLIQRIS